MFETGSLRNIKGQVPHTIEKLSGDRHATFKKFKLLNIFRFFFFTIFIILKRFHFIKSILNNTSTCKWLFPSFKNIRVTASKLSDK